MQPRSLLLALLAFVSASLLGAAPAIAPVPQLTAGKTKVVIIPVQEQVDSPLLFIIRRGLKEAIEAKADVVVLDMKTPGGALGATFEIMEALAKFPGKTITYVNTEAISAGAFIAATTEEIWFSPDAVIGAAAPVQAGGKDVDETMKLKIVSYLKARMRAISEGKGHRGEVISAMIDSTKELKIGDKVIKEKGELLSLTATEAMKTYGEPPAKLLATGIAKTLDELLTEKFGADRFTSQRLEITWSERLAVFINTITPILMGLGMLALYIEFKTPGFGVFGITGIVCLGIVFLGSYVAGLSGHEPMLVFGLGVAMVAVEIFFFPGVVVLALSGVVLMFGSLVWSMADLWPNEPISVAWSGDAFVAPLGNLGLGVLLAVGLALALAKFIPKGWFFTRLAVAQPIAGSAQMAGAAPDVGANAASLIGRTAIAATGLYPSGQIELDGRHYEARVEVGSVPPGARVVVRRKTDFGLVVDRSEKGSG